jgi:hypothetical protein
MQAAFALPPPDGVMREIPTAPRAFMPAGAPRPLSEPPVVASVRRVYARSPARSMKIAIAIGGVLAVLIGFGALTMAKLLAQSFGIMKSERGAPAKAASPASTRTTPLDAGRAPP